MLRSILDNFYLLCGYLAATFMVGIGVCILVQITWRMLGVTFDATEASGFCLASATFLGLAHTLRHGSHVRINLLTCKLPKRLQHSMNIVNCLLGSAVAGYLAWNVILLALQSFNFHDVSPGLLGMPMWIPQAGAALGVTALAIALLDELLWLVAGGESRCETEDEIDIDAPVA
jgi:TRAP-type C4-dicarboxylate transport system permease small subunit